MKKKMVRFFWGCMGVVLCVTGIRFLTKLTDPGYAYSKNKEFVENSEIYEVLFFGDSHMANAVYPMELWNSRGIVSYNLAGFGNSIPATYWFMKNALTSSDPELVVMDCHNLRGQEKVARKEMLHAQIDHLPLDGNKLRMICDLMDDPKDRLEFIWDFAAYHDRWWDLDQADFEKEINWQKGAEIAVNVKTPRKMADRPSETISLDSTGVDYLCRIIEECQSRDTELLLTYLPFPASEEEWQEALYAEQLAGEYGIPYINFLDLSVVDLSVDCSDDDSHLNGSGGRKVTEYLGQYIKGHYDIADHRGEEEYDGWEEDYRQYTGNKLEIMSSLETLDKYLMMLADPAFDCCIYVNGEADVWQKNEIYLPLVNNIAGKGAERLEEAAAAGEDYFLVVDHQKGQIYESVGTESLQGECSFGKICYMTGEDGGKTLTLGDAEENYLQMTSQGSSVSVRIIVTDRENGSIVNEKRFDNKLSVYTE